ncbi:unnamed protein product [Phytophthora fragariaefolia]|uniref:Unnamed protein product n=1 Tax=Phytophthora fragariaefolia TaxID=1490495 RepID=A0A9W6YEM3_9STRA|nr:unnamed protein product [Phytophthora fragariaefolia]
MFIGPKLTADQAVVVLSQHGSSPAATRHAWHALCNLSRACTASGFATLPRPSIPLVPSTRCLLFTVDELHQLASKLQLPVDGVNTTEGDNVPPVEARAMVGRRLSEASKLFTIASEFGRSTAAYSRVFAATVQIMYDNHREILYLHDALIKERIDEYCDATHASRSSFSSTVPDFRIDWHWSA